jgi:hypothetical protein
MAGPVPTIHVFETRKAWMPATSAGMTAHTIIAGLDPGWETGFWKRSCAKKNKCALIRLPAMMI